MSHKRTQLHAMSRIRNRCHTRELNFMQCPETETLTSHKRSQLHAVSRNRDTNVTQENTTSTQCPETDTTSHKRAQRHAMSRITDVTQENTTLCNVQNQTQMSHKKTQLYAMSRIRHRCHTREHNFMQCPESDTCHTREHNFMQCPDSDTDVTQENTTSCNVQKQTQMSHKRTQLHAMSRLRHRCHTREHNFMQCPKSDTDVTQENTNLCNVQKQTPHPSGRHTREHNIRQVPGTDRKQNLFQKQTPPCCSRVRPEHSFKRIPEKDKMSNTASDRNSKFRQVPGNDEVAVVLSNRPETQLHNFPPKKDRPDPRTNLCFRKKTTAVIVNMDRAINHSVKWYLYGAKVPMASRNIIATNRTRSLPVQVLGQLTKLKRGREGWRGRGVEGGDLKKEKKNEI